MRVFAILFLSLWVTPAFAQSVYVGAAAGLDQALFTHVEVGGERQGERGGATPVFAIRGGLGLGERWGTEVEVAYAFAREHEVEARGEIFNTSVLIGSFPIRVSPAIRIESEEQLTTVNAAGWYSYPINARVDLVFAAGLAFTRMSLEQRQEFDFNLPTGFPATSILVPFGPLTTTVVSYDVGPLVGLEGRIRFGDRVRLVPALRLTGVAEGWSVRPTVGVDWTF
jgi:hypothetical protein